MLNKEQFGYSHLSTGVDWDCTDHCGSGIMPVLSVNGRIHPCIGWLPHTQVDKAGFTIGTAEDGLTAFDILKLPSCGGYGYHILVPIPIELFQ